MKKLICLLVALFISSNSSANELIIGVPNVNWLPISFEENGKLKGADIDVMKEIFSQANIDIRFKRLPFPRLLEEMAQGHIDAMAANKKPERLSFMYFPQEPLNFEENHLVVPKNSKLKFSGDLSILNDHTVGVVKGWSYGGLFDKADGFEKIVLNTQKAMVKNVAIGRLDAGVGVRFDMLDRANKQGHSEDIRIEPIPVIRTPYYLAFSKKEGHEQLSMRVSSLLKDFKKTSQFQSIYARYGLLAQ